MKRSFYFTLARDSIRKNKRLYFPFLLTAAGMTAIFYILHSLLFSPLVTMGPGKRTLTQLFSFGCIVLAVFSAVFLYYTHSTLIRRRKKEFGLYSVLGMDKRAIGRVTAAETLLEALGAIVPGTLSGILFSKLAEMIVGRILDTSVAFTLNVPAEILAFTAEIYSVIFLILFLRTFAEVRFSSPIHLLQSENLGEKPPRGSLLWGLAGTGLLIGAYYIALSIQSPLSSLLFFFFAVLMVIAGTYLLFISGSVYLLRLLQKNKRFYYNRRHFVSISSMVYRMKRNGAGLASICILCTMVLVIVSSTGSLIIGAEDSLKQRYPRDVSLGVTLRSMAADKAFLLLKETEERTLKLAEECGVVAKDPVRYRSVDFSGYMTDGEITPDGAVFSHFAPLELDRTYQFTILPREECTGLVKEALPPLDGGIYLYLSRPDTLPESVTLPGMAPMTVKPLSYFPVSGSDAAITVPTMYLLTDHFDEIARALLPAAEGDKTAPAALSWSCSFDTESPLEAQTDMRARWRSEALSFLHDEAKGFSTVFEVKEAERGEFFAMNGSLFFLGIMLSLVFLSGTVLLIYFKQLSEGYEDQKRFAIMRRVGMTREDIRKSVNSQVLTVFFIPLVFAALHLSFAFPMIKKLLFLFGLRNTALFFSVTCAAFVLFSLFYALVYRLTSNAYFDIVTTREQEE